MRYRIEQLAECLSGRVPHSADLVCITNLANRHLVTPQLHVALSNYRPRTALESAVAGYWESIYQANRTRNRRLGRQLSELLETLNAAGVVPLLLTGAGALATSARASGRMVADLDIMFGPDDVGKGMRALAEDGYRPWEEAGRRHTAAKLFKPPHIGLVHVHRRPPDTATAMSVEDMMRDAQTVVFDAHHALLPSPTDRWCYLIGHDMLEDRGLHYGELNLRHLMDAREAIASGSIDWERVSRRFGSGIRKLACGLYRENLRRLFGTAGLPGAPSGSICSVLFHRQMLRSEERLYAAFDQTLLVLPLRASHRLRRYVQSALQSVHPASSAGTSR